MRLTSPLSLSGIAAAAFALGMGTAYGVSDKTPRGFAGDFSCENFGLPDKSYRVLRVDSNLNVYGTSPGKEQIPLGRLDLRSKDLAYFDISGQTLAWKKSPLDPLAQYIVDNAGDALLILEMQGERARMSYVCRRNL